MSFTVAMIGCHGSGKTTLGSGVAQVLSWRFDAEIGDALVTEALREGVPVDARTQPAAFDRRITELEISRDQDATIPRIIETWHPGNLAYASLRNPDIYPILRGMAGNAIARLKGRIAAQPLVVDFATYRARFRAPTTEPAITVPWMFQIGEKAVRIAAAMGLDLLPPVDTSMLSISEAVARCRGNIEHWIEAAS